ncbi:zinc finger C2HC domain-containing protein 1C [Sorex fumeus]|uniref:zinc finger C2HC domain-containing protein 1C n=1 Tax=Sorex fumeus TaxID=62283 RepID=UPI0024AD977D|nr:zinc finger C2HC domain-containing protein 1C [Sorex fumeus]XP_055989758.1 zinc finger C2HC domain-containing protein 1C [Sorex fumeus]
MADLQLGPLPVGVMLPHNQREGPALRSTKQDPYRQAGSSQRPSVVHLKDYSQHKLLSTKEVALESVSIHPTWDSLKIRSCYPPHFVGTSHEDSGNHLQAPAKGLVYSSDPPPCYLQANNQDFIPFARKRIGVDRAYPLKPVCHRKSHSTGETHSVKGHNVSLRSLEPRRFSCGSLGSPVFDPIFDATQREGIMANHPRAERIQIQRLEAEGASLQEEIRRKEALLKEKLKKTVEELRRIQKEREQAKENEKREIQRITLPVRTVKGNRNALYRPTFTPAFCSEEMSSRDRREGETWERSWENSGTFQFSDDELQRLRREKLVANNNRMQDQGSGPLMDTLFFQPSEAALGAGQGSFSNSSLSRASDSSSSDCSTREPELGECIHCGRRFLLPRLERHSNICSRMQASKRKVFDSSRARAKGTELEEYLNWKGSAAFVKAEPPPKSNWRQKHESFIRTLRQAREIQQVIAKGGKPSELPPIPPAENPDYVQCPHCSRHFAPKVAERHVPKCKTIKNRPPPPRKHCT